MLASPRTRLPEYVPGTPIRANDLNTIVAGLEFFTNSGFAGTYGNGVIVPSRSKVYLQYARGIIDPFSVFTRGTVLEGSSQELFFSPAGNNRIGYGVFTNGDVESEDNVFALPIYFGDVIVASSNDAEIGDLCVVGEEFALQKGYGQFYCIGNDEELDKKLFVRIPNFTGIGSWYDGSVVIEFNGEYKVAAEKPYNSFNMDDLSDGDEVSVQFDNLRGLWYISGTECIACDCDSSSVENAPQINAFVMTDRGSRITYRVQNTLSLRITFSDGTPDWVAYYIRNNESVEVSRNASAHQSGYVLATLIATGIRGQEVSAQSSFYVN